MSRATPNEGRSASVHSWAGLGAWVVGLLAIIVILPLLGPDIAAPPLFDGLDSLRSWGSTRSAPDVVAGGLRLVVSAMAWYLLVATLVGAGLRIVARGRTSPGGRLADLLLVPPVRRMLTAAIGAGLSAAAIGASAAASSTVDAPALMRRVGEVVGTETGAATIRQIPEGAADMVRIPVDPTTAESAPTEAAGATDQWTVVPGDHLWSIAERRLAERLGRPATDAEIDPYWRVLIEANRQQLADPDNPDLVFPGQRMVVPPPT